LPLLEDAKRVARTPLLVSSVRDLVQPKPDREAETLALIERYFDRVLVHGDARLASFERTFSLAAQLERRLHYTGYVVDEPAASKAGTGEVIVSAGGGAVGAHILRTALAARADSLLRESTWRLLAGVNCSERELRALREQAGPGVIVERSRADFAGMLANCAVSVSQAGYNTVAEVLKARARAVLVPFVGEGESEQMLRAQLLAERGAVQLVEEALLTPQSLAAAVNRAVRGPRPDIATIEVDGAWRTAELLRGWLT
jgi:predicted glycosyltransferase